eukprot:m.256129 g.256129  ORF g.256129 m.256129 type:complete len:630 (+) comp19958_c0_seq1:54-1943(+)
MAAPRARMGTRIWRAAELRTWPAHAAMRQLPAVPDPAATMRPELNARLILWLGDIATLAVDAIIVPTPRDMLSPVGFVSGCVQRAAGPQLRRTLAPLIATLHPGEAASTPAFGLAATNIVHVQTSAAERPGVLAGSYRTGLDGAWHLQARTLAIASLGADLPGMTNYEAARIAVQALRVWLETNHEKVDHVILCAAFLSDFELYEELLLLYFPVSDTSVPRVRMLSEGAASLASRPFLPRRPALSASVSPRTPDTIIRSPGDLPSGSLSHASKPDVTMTAPSVTPHLYDLRTRFSPWPASSPDMLSGSPTSVPDATSSTRPTADVQHAPPSLRLDLPSRLRVESRPSPLSHSATPIDSLRPDSVAGLRSASTASSADTQHATPLATPEHAPRILASPSTRHALIAESRVPAPRIAAAASSEVHYATISHAHARGSHGDFNAPAPAGSGYTNIPSALDGRTPRPATGSSHRALDASLLSASSKLHPAVPAPAQADSGPALASTGHHAFSVESSRFPAAVVRAFAADDPYAPPFADGDAYGPYHTDSAVQPAPQQQAHASGAAWRTHAHAPAQGRASAAWPAHGTPTGLELERAVASSALALNGDAVPANGRAAIGPAIRPLHARERPSPR